MQPIPRRQAATPNPVPSGKQEENPRLRRILDPPPDTPSVRRYLARHPEAVGLSAAELDEHVFRRACRGIENIRHHIRQSHEQAQQPCPRCGATGGGDGRP